MAGIEDFVIPRKGWVVLSAVHPGTRLYEGKQGDVTMDLERAQRFMSEREAIMAESILGSFAGGRLRYEDAARMEEPAFANADYGACDPQNATL
jgi:hypothetical protein